MKLLLLFVGILIMLSAIQAQFPPQQEKEAILRLNKADVENIYNAVEDAALPGSIRKPLLQKLAAVYMSTWPTQPQGKDSTTKNKKP
mgnify:CR=1 FL=1